MKDPKLAAVLGCLLSLTGCGDSLSKSEATDLIKGWFAAGCQSTVVARQYQNNDPVGFENSPGIKAVKQLDDWIHVHIETNKQNYTLVSDTSNNVYWRKELYHYSVDGRRISEVLFTRSDYAMGTANSAYAIRTYAVSLQFCPQLPDTVNILDISLGSDKKSATAIFTLQYRPTPIAAQLMEAGFFSGAPGLVGEHGMTFRRLDATGWRATGWD